MYIYISEIFIKVYKKIEQRRTVQREKKERKGVKAQKERKGHEAGERNRERKKGGEKVITLAACSWNHDRPAGLRAKPRPACPSERGKRAVISGTTRFRNSILRKRVWDGGTFLVKKNERNAHIPYSSSYPPIVHICNFECFRSGFSCFAKFVGVLSCAIPWLWYNCGRGSAGGIEE